ncbi:MAG: hypothetical protein ACYC27_07020 [Armatimonadota bacterium]
MDQNFIRKIYPSIAWIWAIAMTWCLVLQKPWIALSITAGLLLGTAVLASFDFAIRKAFVPGAKSPGHSLLKLAIIKYPLMGLYVYLVIKWGKINLLAFCGGVILVHLAIFAKLAGVRMMERRKEQNSDSAKKSEES